MAAAPSWALGGPVCVRGGGLAPAQGSCGQEWQLGSWKQPWFSFSFPRLR